MPLQSEIIQRLSADNSQFRSVMNQSELVADKVGKSIFKKLDLRAAMTAVAVALGINFQNIANNVARYVIGFSKEQEEALNKLVEATGKAAAEQEAALDKLRAKKAKEAQDEIDRAESTYEIIRDARIKGAEMEAEALRKIRQANFDEQQESDEAHAKAVKDNVELLTLEAKARRGLTAEEAERLVQLREQTKEIGRQQEITTLLTLNKRTPEEEALLQTLIKQSAAYKDGLKTVTATKTEIAAIAPVIESNIDKWREFVGVIKSTGRGDRELSDRELERKIANIGAELSASAGRSLGTYQGSAGTGSSDFLTEQQRGAATQAQAELDFRRQVRQVAATQGEGAAFNQFNGVSEQRLREILQSAPGTQDVVAELKKLNGHLNQGVKTAVFATE